MDRYKLSIDENQLKERINCFVSQLENGQESPRQELPKFFFQNGSFEVRPQESNREAILRGEYNQQDDFLELRLSVAEGRNNPGSFSERIFKIVSLTVLIILSIALLILTLIAFNTRSFPILTLIALAVVLNLTYQTFKFFNTSCPSKIFNFQKFFISSFREEEISKIN